jgi:ABC-type transport system substrate-binding protein
MKHFPILANRWLSFNMRDPIWGKNINLRKAIAFSIDRDLYLEKFSQRTSLKAHSLLVPGIPGYNPSKDLPFDYDLERAKSMLTKAGYPEGKGLELTYSTRGNQVTHIAEAEFFKQQLELLGIKVQIEILSFQDFLSKGRAGKLQLFTDNWWFDYPDGENILQLLVSKNIPGINKSGYINKEIDELYSKLQLTLDKDEKIEIMNEFEDLIFADLPWIPLMYESSYILQKYEVKNFRKSSVVRNFVKYLKVYQGD